jgi:SAM-dependent methyltransferase
MKNPQLQTGYWDKAAESKTFTHPVPLAVFRQHLPLSAKILDYGCGYGRTCAELADAGYRNITGIDISSAMIHRGQRTHKTLDLQHFDGCPTDFDSTSFDACLLLAVLTCIPSDKDQEKVFDEIFRLLVPGGVLFISDYPLQPDARNRKRYEEFHSPERSFGTFVTEGVVMRHHDMNRILALLSGYGIVWRQSSRVPTMNGNDSEIFQILARKP